MVCLTRRYICANEEFVWPQFSDIFVIGHENVNQLVIKGARASSTTL